MAPFILVTLVTTGLAQVRGAEAPPAVRDELVTMTQKLFDAIAAGDRATWDHAAADDAVFIDEFSRRQTKAELLADLHPLPAGFSGNIEVRTPVVRVHGDEAVLDCEAYEQEKVFDQQLLVRYRVAMSFARLGGAWRVTLASWVTIPTPPPSLVVADLTLDEYPGVYRYGPGRAFTVVAAGGQLSFTTKPGGKPTRLDPLAKDVFMDEGDEKNLLVFRRGADGRITELIERRKFNDLHMRREPSR